MSDQFKVPEPSEKATAEAARDWRWTADTGSHHKNVESQLRAAYAVDVPAIVRAEVERALRKRQEDPLNFGIAAYLAARFGAAPELKEGPLGERWPVNKVWPETKQEGHHLGCCLDLDHKGPCLKRCVPENATPEPMAHFRNGEPHPLQEHLPGTVRAVLDERLEPAIAEPLHWPATAPVYTDAERDFLRALARKELCAETHPNYAGYEQDAMEAACRVVEEAK